MKISIILATFKKADKKNEYPVYIRIEHKRKRRYISTSYKAKKNEFGQEEFNNNKANYRTLNNLILKQKLGIEKSVLENKLTGKSINLSDYGKKSADQKPLLTVAQSFDKYIDYNKVRLSKKTLGSYEAIKKFICQKKELNLSIVAISSDWLTLVEKRFIEKGYAQNTIWSYLKNIKCLVRWCKKRNIIDSYPFENFNFPKYQEKEMVFLSIEEVDKLGTLLDLGFFENPKKKHELILSWFLFSVWSGLRYSDIKKIDLSKNIIKNDMQEYLYVSTTKTGQIVSIPIRKELRKAVNRCLNKDKKFTPSSCLKNLKEIMDMVGIKKKVGFHTARHTFGFLCAYLNIRPEVCQRWMGHSSIKTTMIYYHITNKTLITQAEKFDRPL